MGELKFEPGIPIFRIFDVSKAKEFYLDFLGFQLDWTHQFADDLPFYMQVSRSGLTLHLSEHFGDANPGSTVYVTASGLVNWQAELIAKQYRNLRPGIKVQADGSAEMELIDPFGNRLRLNQESPA
jgi:ribosomal-protein-alanine N-acetyltransferase